PQRQRQAELVPDVGDAGHPVLVPAIGARPCVVVRERRPGVAVGAVVLAHRAPGALGEIGTPLVPGVRVEEVVLGPPRRLGQAPVLGGACAAGLLGRSGHDVSPENAGVSSCAAGTSSGTTVTWNRCQPQPGSSTYSPSFRSAPERS